MNINFFENRPMRFGKYKGQTLKWIYENNFKHAKWMAKNFTKPRGDYKLFFEFVKIKIHENIEEYVERKIEEDYERIMKN